MSRSCSSQTHATTWQAYSFKEPASPSRKIPSPLFMVICYETATFSCLQENSYLWITTLIPPPCQRNPEKSLLPQNNPPKKIPGNPGTSIWCVVRMKRSIPALQTISGNVWINTIRAKGPNTPNHAVRSYCWLLGNMKTNRPLQKQNIATND